MTRGKKREGRLEWSGLELVWLSLGWKGGISGGQGVGYVSGG